MKRVVWIHISTFMIVPNFTKSVNSYPPGPKTVRFVG